MMKKIKEYCANERQTIKETIAIIQNNLSRCVIVLNDNGKVIGVFSEGDVLRAILNDIDIHTPLKKVISPSFRYLKDNDMLKAYNLVKSFGITLIPVVDANFNLKDVITIFDVLDHLSYKNSNKK